ncbi:MAG TPA: branched-chain amino acid ABC transporter permease [Acidimicrobiales bacterium]|nr:branched-chain amino acid ABC transporter permease [Acidimicrobiales bacterium]
MNTLADLRGKVSGKIPQYNVRDAGARWWAGLPRWARVVLIAAVIGFFFVLPSLTIPLIDTPTPWASVLFSPIALYVLAALGLNIVVGYAGLLDLGYVAFYAIGAYTIAVLTSAHGSLSFWVALPFAVAAAMFAGLLLGTPTLRLRGDYLAIVTLGFGEIIRITANNIEWLGGPRGITNIPRPSDIGPLHFEGLNAKPYYYVGLTFIMLVILMVRAFERSRVGRAWTAIREDEDAAELMGVPTFKFKLWAFAMGAGIGGLSGALFASYQTVITPNNFTLQFSILFLAAVVLGGAGNIPGVILGAVLVAYLPERFRGLGGQRVFWYGVALVAMMVFRPQGIWPSRRRAAELADPEAGEVLAAVTEADVERIEEELEDVSLPAHELEGHHDG